MICPRCSAWMADTDSPRGWKRCHSCGYACDKEGYNLLNPKPDEISELDKIVKKVEDLPVIPYISVEPKEDSKDGSQDAVPIIGIKIDF